MVRRSAFEPRPNNRSYDLRVPTRSELGRFRALSRVPSAERRRVTGNFRGTTDEIIQWAAWKWGIDEDLLRAVAARESDWHQGFVGDQGESYGLMQVKRTAWHGTSPIAKKSTSFNIDVYGAALRSYYDGQATWLNDVSGNGAGYQAGDLWGSVGAWYSGRWHDAGAEQYIAAVRRAMTLRPWLMRDF
jgi:autotransporter family porin